jgi:mono/diheme cytochrome c family protein
MEEYIDIELEEEQIAQDFKFVQGGDVRRGKELIEKYGCTGCHEIEGVEDPGEIGLELTEIGDIHISRLDFGEINVDPKHHTVPNWLYNKMKNPRLFKKELKMPDYNFSDIEAEAMTTYLLSLKSEEVSASYVLSIGTPPSEYNPQGEFGKILKKYRCLVCHKINGRGGEVAPDLSQEGSRVQKEWLLKRFMKKPYAIRPILVERMLRFKMSDSEIETLYDYFRTTLVDDRVENLSGVVNEMSLHDPRLIRMGKKLYYEKYACNACHQINLKGGTIGPDLTDAGKRLSTKWIVYYLRDPKAFVRRSVEPVFKLTDKEIEALTAFLINLKEKE